MAFSAARFRRWFAIAIAVVCIAIAITFFYARHRVQNALKQVPEKLNITVQQSAQAFAISKSEQGRTLFKLQANKAVKYKGNGRVELTDVMVTVYGRDSSRFDQIYGKKFEYDQQSGDVTSAGEVSIDLQSNPQGTVSSDQTTPRELKNPIHVKTTNLVFNQKTGDARTDSKVEFSLPQLSGSAIGARYDADQSTLTLQSQVEMATSGAKPVTICAQRALLNKSPRQIVLQKPQAQSKTQRGRSDEATLFLRDDNRLDHAIGVGNVVINSTQSKRSGKSLPMESEVTAQTLDVVMRPGNQIETAVLSGGVHFNGKGTQESEGWAGRAVLNFGKKNTVSKIHAEQQVKLLQHHAATGNSQQDVEITAPVLDAFLEGRDRLSRAETSGPPEIRFIPVGSKQGSETRVTADKFTAKFDSLGQLSQVHGEAHARTASTPPAKSGIAQPERVTTSEMIDAYFRPGTGIESMVQRGQFTYTSGTQEGFADQARYTPADQMLLLTGSPRVADSGMETTGQTVRLNRTTGQAFVEGDVKTSYNDLKQQANGALLASSDPIHVTANDMTAHNSPAIAVYKGNVRLWQNANMIEAPTIQFRKDQRVVIADSSSGEKVSTVLTSADKNGKTTPVRITSEHLTYSDVERKAHYEGSVTAESKDVRMTAAQMDVSFAPNSSVEGCLPHASSADTPEGPQPSTTQARLDKIIASGNVSVTQPKRRATGDKLVYTSADDKFVLTGGPPAIFDAEHGKTVGTSITLFRDEDRVLVEGNTASPSLTETRVNRTH